MRLSRSRIFGVDPHIVWKHVSDPTCYPEFMAHLERWETVTDGPVGIGSRFTVHWRVGSVPIGGVIEVVEFDDARDLAWIGITGVTLRGRFRLRECGDGKTKVTFRLAYEAPGGVLGLIADRVAARQVGRIMNQTLVRLQDLTES
ncbi:SRPBCC family protein [Mycolicibacterium psychrotolerans]|uniref:Cyclase n=1 Tax=Mycolicibacterium psychrotolerans TaxID=216929 RepID=A0A7I7M7R4_9MYCO|nr:SRPBCC family protein [Mycolicibacterium psychrotolerans]KRE27118.1 cyclase [Mycobacterium sp. Soil538]BBX67573.1 hypothetical protein MPSYJ_10340 [Mycolicibacterium psychrotolerans]